MAEKKSFVLRIDTEVYKALEKWASDEFRSVNGQIEWLLNKELKNNGRSPKDSAETAKTKSASKKTG